eukprot:COSAG01_NODE_9551_length_2411_cov_4350.086505_1_plen_39_part_00
MPDAFGGFPAVVAVVVWARVWHTGAGEIMELIIIIRFD